MKKKQLKNIIITLTLVLVAGCSSKPAVKKNVVVSQQPDQSVAAKTLPAPESKPQEQDPVNYCRQALNALKQIDQNKAARYAQSFNNLVNAASKYNAVRMNISGSTRKTVDSLYQFKTAKLCADIDKELMDSLVNGGERTVR
jgi:PBP1b-binding outer membrane lipoprotein LpoB